MRRNDNKKHTHTPKNRLARRAGRPTARLLVCLGGCPNFGPGAVAPCTPGAASAEVEPEALAAATDYFEDLGEKALAQVCNFFGTSIKCFHNDLVCSSSKHDFEQFFCENILSR